MLEFFACRVERLPPGLEARLVALMSQCFGYEVELAGTVYWGEEDEEIKVACDFKRPWLANVCVPAAYRGQGFASRLLEYVLPQLSSVLLRVSKTNLAAQHLYAKFSFRVVRTGPSHLIMTNKTPTKSM